MSASTRKTKADLEILLRQTEDKLSEYITVCRQHEHEIHELRKDLNHEMDVSERLQDLNIALKGKIKEMSRVAKVRVHPSSMEVLQRLIDEKTVAINTLREALHLAIRLIPEDRYRRMHIPGLQKIYNEVF